MHTRRWLAAVELVRRELGLPGGDEAAIESWLAGRERLVRDTVLQAFTGLALPTGLSGRYLEYFLACVLSHHSGGTLHHSLPQWLSLGVMPLFSMALAGDLFTADGYYRAYYSARVEAPPGFQWRPVGAPRAFSVAWPNVQYAALDEPLLNYLTREVRERLGETLMWFVRGGYVIGDASSGALRDGWLLYSPAVEGKSVHEVLGLDESTPVQTTVSAIPIVVLSSDVIALDARGGGSIDMWRQPRVERDPTIDKQDRACAARCERVVELLAGNPELSWSRGGRPATTTPAPGAEYLAYIEEEYRQELRTYDRRPRRSTLRTVRNTVIKRGERHFPPEQRKPLPRGWFERLEDEQPGKRRQP